MNKNILIFFISLIWTSISLAQEYKISKSTGRLVINVPGVTVEGYDGTEIVIKKDTLNEIKFKSNGYELSKSPNRLNIITSRANIGETDRMKGLKLINESGLVDNTNMGIQIKEEAGVITISQVSKRDFIKLYIKVPKNIKIKYFYSDFINSQNLVFLNLEEELEVNSGFSSIKIENVTGPTLVKTTKGNIEVVLSSTIKNPISLISQEGFLDLNLPVSSNVNITTNSTLGDVFVSPDLKLNIEKQDQPSPYINFGSNKLKSKMNGGGTEVSLVTIYGNIYLRTQKFN